MLLALVGYAMYGAIIDKAIQERKFTPSPRGSGKNMPPVNHGLYERGGQFFAVYEGTAIGSWYSQVTAEQALKSYGRRRAKMSNPPSA